LHGARHEHLPWLRLLRHPGPDVHGDAADLAVHDLALAGVQARADLQAEPPHDLGDRAGTADGTGGAVEAGEEAVPGHIELGAAEAEELAANQRVVSLEEVPPGAVAELRRPRGRADDVGEENRGQDAPDVDLLVHPMERLERAGARTEAEHLEERLRLGIGESSEGVDRLSGLLARAEDTQVTLDLAFALLLGAAPGVVRGPHPPGE